MPISMKNGRKDTEITVLFFSWILLIILYVMRLEPSLHRQLYLEAKHSGISLNQWVTEAIRRHLQERHV